jgi:hypothetical protein
MHKLTGDWQRAHHGPSNCLSLCLLAELKALGGKSATMSPQSPITSAILADGDTASKLYFDMDDAHASRDIILACL